MGDLARGFICSFSDGIYSVQSPSGKTSLLFEDSDRFGPSKCHPRTADLEEVPDRLRWFWDAYPAWREAGRPVSGSMSSPIGDIHTADFSSMFAEIARLKGDM